MKEAIESTVEFRGGDLWVQSGNLDKPGAVRIFVHGNSAPASAWLTDTIKQQQDAGKPYIVFDLPGHGKSSRYDDYSLNTMVDALKAVITEMKLDQRAGGYDGIGWSYGGNILMQAMEQGKLPKLNSLTLVGTPPMNMTGREELASEFRDSQDQSFAYDTVIQNAYFLTADLTREQYDAMGQSFLCHSDKGGCAVPDTLRQALREVDPDVRSHLLASIQNGELKDEISILQNRGDIPLMILVGEKDAIANPAYIQSIKDMIGATQITILPDSGHAVMTENSEKTGNTLNRFLEQAAQGPDASSDKAPNPPSDTPKFKF